MMPLTAMVESPRPRGFHDGMMLWVSLLVLLISSACACEDINTYLETIPSLVEHNLVTCDKVAKANQCSNEAAASIYAYACPVTCKLGCGSPADAICADDDEGLMSSPAGPAWRDVGITTCKQIADMGRCVDATPGATALYSFYCPVSCKANCCLPSAITKHQGCLAAASCKDDDEGLMASEIGRVSEENGVTTCQALAARGFCAPEKVNIFHKAYCPVSCQVGCCDGSKSPTPESCTVESPCQDDEDALANYVKIYDLPQVDSCFKVAEKGLCNHSPGLSQILAHSCPVSCGLGCCSASQQNLQTKEQLPFPIPFDTSAYQERRFEHRSNTDGSAAVVYWRLEKDMLYLGMASNSEYVGFGLNQKGPGMPGSDIVICQHQNERVVVGDYHGVEYSWPRLDDQQDWSTLGSGYTDGVTWCEVSRPRSACNLKEDVSIGADLSRFMYALLAWAPPCAPPGYVGYHGTSHRRTVAFTFESGAEPELSDDERTFDIAAPAHTVSTAPGSYACSYHKLPLPNNGDERVDIVRQKILQSGPSKEADLNHHVDINKCASPLEGVADGQEVNCDDTMAKCWELLLSPYLTLPSNQGIPIGGDFVRYVIVRRHFYNPSGREGLVDTGTRLHVTYSTTLRPKVLSSLSLSVEDAGINVPPSTKRTVSNVCPSTCTERLGTVTIAQVFFHMHFVAGSSAALRVVREGQELEPIAKVDPWTPGQELVGTNFQLLPGDTLLFDCVFDNKNNFTVTGGEAADDEMCWAGLTIIGDPTDMKSCYNRPTKGDVWCPSSGNSGAGAIVKLEGKDAINDYIPHKESTFSHCPNPNPTPNPDPNGGSSGGASPKPVPHPIPKDGGSAPSPSADSGSVNPSPASSMDSTSSSPSTNTKDAISDATCRRCTVILGLTILLTLLA